MLHAKSSSKMLKVLAITLLLVALLLPMSAFAEETQVDTPASGEGSSGSSASTEAGQEPEAVLYDAPNEVSVTSEEPADGQEIQTMTSEKPVDEPVMMEDTAANENGEVTDDLKRTVTLTGAPESEDTSSNQNIILYSVIGALAGVIAVLGTILYRKRQS